MAIYESLKPISNEDAQIALSSSDVERINDALLRLSLFSPDWRSIQGVCLRFLKHPAADVRGLAATCLGHLARLHRILDLEIVVPALKSLLDDPQAGGRAQDALDDINVYIGRQT